MNPPIRHPGPIAPVRHGAAPAEAVRLDLLLEAGDTLQSGLGRCLADCDSAYLELADARFAPFRYVMPAAAPDDQHAAWYSDVYPLATATIARAGAIVGRRDGAPFVHCHGLWRGPDGDTRMGHALPPECVLAAPTRVRGTGLRGAAFNQRYDPETNFPLFAAEPVGAPGPAFAVTLRPNQDVTHALAALCAGRAIRRIQGIGSLNGARFDDAPPMASFASEFLVLDSRPPRLQVAVVAIDGTIHRGWLTPGANPVCVTCEFVLSGF